MYKNISNLLTRQFIIRNPNRSIHHHTNANNGLKIFLHFHIYLQFKNPILPRFCNPEERLLVKKVETKNSASSSLKISSDPVNAFQHCFQSFFPGGPFQNEVLKKSLKCNCQGSYGCNTEVKPRAWCPRNLL